MTSASGGPSGPGPGLSVNYDQQKMTSKEEEKVITNPKKISLKDYKPGPPRPVHKKYAGLPAPPLTRARARAQAESSTVIAAMSSEPPIEDSYLVDRHTSGYVQYWDDFFHRRLEIDLFPCPTWTLHSISWSTYALLLFRLANLDLQDVPHHQRNPTWKQLSSQVSYLGLVNIVDFWKCC